MGHTRDAEVHSVKFLLIPDYCFSAPQGYRHVQCFTHKHCNELTHICVMRPFVTYFNEYSAHDIPQKTVVFCIKPFPFSFFLSAKWTVIYVSLSVWIDSSIRCSPL